MRLYKFSTQNSTNCPRYFEWKLSVDTLYDLPNTWCKLLSTKKRAISENCKTALNYLEKPSLMLNAFYILVVFELTLIFNTHKAMHPYDREKIYMHLSLKLVDKLLSSQRNGGRRHFTCRIISTFGYQVKVSRFRQYFWYKQFLIYILCL